MRLLGLILWCSVMAGAGYALFSITYRVEVLEEEMVKTKQRIIREQDAIHVLEAEWSYLNGPEMLRTLTEQFLPYLEPVEAGQIVSFDDLPHRQRQREEER